MADTADTADAAGATGVAGAAGVRVWSGRRADRNPARPLPSAQPGRSIRSLTVPSRDRSNAPATTRATESTVRQVAGS